jgi:hypothetical protein
MKMLRQSVIAPLRGYEKFAAHNIFPPSGVLFHGPPGNKFSISLFFYYLASRFGINHRPSIFLLCRNREDRSRKSSGE